MAKSVTLSYSQIRNVTPPGVDSIGMTVYKGVTTIGELRKLNDEGNVRTFLPSTPNRGNTRYTSVHAAIYDTLENHPELFPLLNGGVTIGATYVELADKEKQVKLVRSSVVNGAQTRGVVHDFLDVNADKADEVFVAFELLVCKDEDILSEVSIARNQQNAVKLMSILAKREVFAGLTASMEAAGYGVRVRETDDWELIDIGQLLKVCFLATPFWIDGKPACSKVSCYSNRSRSMRDFEALVESKDTDEDAGKHLKFILEAAPVIWAEYEGWQSEQGLQGHKYRWIERDEEGVHWLPDGVVFPIMAAMAPFISKVGKTWRYGYEHKLRQRVLEKAATLCSRSYNGQPSVMGKSSEAYEVMSTLVEGRLPEKVQDLMLEMNLA